MISYINLFKNYHFSKYFLATNFINIANSFATVTLIWLIYKETNNPLFIALFTLINQLPQLTVGNYVSKFVDNFEINKTLGIILIVKATLFFILIFIPLENYYLILVALLLMLNSTLSLPISSGLNVYISLILDKKSLITANALLTISFDLAYIVGSLAVTIVLFVKNSGLAFLLPTTFYLLAALLFFNIAKVGNYKNDKIVLKSSLLTVSKFLITNSKLTTMLIITTLWNTFIWGTVTISMPIYVKYILHGDAFYYGVLNSMQSVGIIFASFILGIITLTLPTKKIIYYGVICQSILIIIFGFVNNYLLAIIVLLLSGLISAPIIIYKTYFYQQNIPKNIRTQSFSLIATLGSVSYIIGNFIVSYFLKVFGEYNVSYIIQTMAILLLLLTVAILKKQ